MTNQRSGHSTLPERGARLAGILIALLAIVCSAASTSQGTRLENVNGGVLVETGDGSYNPYQPGSALASGDRIILTDGASAILRADDCSLPLAANSVYEVEGQPCARIAEPMLLAVAPAAASADTAAAMGTIWNDVNSDSIRGAGEGPRAGVNIVLANNNCEPGVSCPLATSDTAGNFGFASLEPGTYDIYVEDDDGNYVLIGNVTLEAGTTTTITIASTPAGFVLVESSVLATAAGVGAAAMVGTTGGGTGAAAATGTAATTGYAVSTGSAVSTGAAASTGGALETVGLITTIGVMGAATYEMSSHSDDDNDDISP